MAGETLRLELDDEIREAIASAFDSGNIVTVAYNDAGWPHVSRRGSTQVFGPRQLAIWVRKRDDGLAKAMGARPEITLFYVDLAERRVVYTFYGRGIVSNDPAVTTRSGRPHLNGSRPRTLSVEAWRSSWSWRESSLKASGRSATSSWRGGRSESTSPPLSENDAE